MHPERKRRLWIVVGSIVALSLGITLVLYAMRQNINYFYTPTQIWSGEAPKERTVNTGGMVVNGSVKRDPESLKVQFVLTDTDKDVTVFYEGILPDLFREGQGIIAIGKITPDNTVQATQILAKHDENYMAPEVKDAIEQAEKRAREKNAAGAGG
ncbi:cytochrome c maturation protein CcmE [Permianibacter aggregans]|uniref:Cytochrome c-type biogenesis protein CcmE n=1 Tax=Permianibacter aggregans TaxID=1510150 RepID=A0A4R6UY09_9GAMM|nr:cytochrome c maturation protein CcmE [Permianibacter aggregans]QGX41397.1 cytochrome c maturation protein CcmE [Permianibacter aggregans]TDQ51186.1 cytochrome c-type biogenesis protein CcmE [Permianibacter aggregans]